MVPSQLFVHRTLHPRIVAEIQRNVVKRGKRSALSRRFHKKEDNEAIAAWRLDLNRILRVFNVRFAIPLQPPLTLCFQTELGVNIHGTESDAREHTPKTRPIISNPDSAIPNVRSGVSNTHAVVSDTNRNQLKTREDTTNLNQAVSSFYILFVTE